MVYETKWGNGEGLLSLRNRTIKKVTEDIEGFGFNTVVSTLMIYANEIHASQKPAKIDIETLLSLLNCLAPHLSEELWEALGHQDFLARQPWPSWDVRYLEDDKVEYVIQLNGKNRETLTVSKSVSQEYVKSTALSLDKIKTMTLGKEIVKTIIVPHRLVNIVVKEKITS
jgi:leucyl-tRNA synthetase